MTKHYQVLIFGGGTAGIMVASQMLKKDSKIKLNIMKKNVGSTDKIVRIILALIATYFAYTGEFSAVWQGYALWAVAVILLVTALTSKCPIFSIFGINTCKVKS
jgi:hypothetical protein